MSEYHMKPENLDRILSAEDKAERDAAIASNDAFVAAMTRASAKGRERVCPGTFVDTSPPIGAKFIRVSAPISVCGSPAAMCAEAGNPHGGAPLALRS